MKTNTTLAEVLAKTLFTKLHTPKTSKEIIKLVNERLPTINAYYSTDFKNISDSKLRAIINEIRMCDLIPGYKLLATSKGYYISDDPILITEFIQSLKGRIQGIQYAIAGLEKTIDESSDLFDQL
jgi:hypothetical protein